jgi:alkyl sulfatase BDS1-like metallo-beta-lactamase superfamily hydrolase
VAPVAGDQARGRVPGRRQAVSGAQGCEPDHCRCADGLVIIDTTTIIDIAQTGLALFRAQAGNGKPVAAVIYTHTHFDHHGRVKGAVEEDDVASGKIPIIAPGTVE